MTVLVEPFHTAECSNVEINLFQAWLSSIQYTSRRTALVYMWRGGGEERRDTGSEMQMKLVRSENIRL